MNDEKNPNLKFVGVVDAVLSRMHLADGELYNGRIIRAHDDITAAIDNLKKLKVLLQGGEK